MLCRCACTVSDVLYVCMYVCVATKTLRIVAYSVVRRRAVAFTAEIICLLK